MRRYQLLSARFDLIGHEYCTKTQHYCFVAGIAAQQNPEPLQHRAAPNEID